MGPCSATTKACTPEPVVHNRRSYHNESLHNTTKSSPHSLQLEKPMCSNDHASQPKIKLINSLKKEYKCYKELRLGFFLKSEFVHPEIIDI